MTDDFYKVFGLDNAATDEEIEARYKELKAKYSEERFSEGEAGNIAAKKLTELETAYEEIKSDRKERSFKDGENDYYAKIEENIRKGDISAAQNLLDEFNERNAEWHYLQSVVFYKKKWHNESKKQLEIAIEMDGNNEKYKTAYNKLNNQINDEKSKNFTDKSGSGAGANNYANENYEDYEDRQMGGDGCLNFCCEMALCNMLLNCCCRCR